MSIEATGVKILLKARPTPAQLRDRLAAPRPDGLELYLDARDITDPNPQSAIRGLSSSGAKDSHSEDWLSRLRTIMADAPRASDGFAYIVEGPIRSLDGEFFDVTRAAAADEEALVRLARFGAELGATVAVIHLIAPTTDPAALRPGAREAAIERALPLLRRYAALCREAGLAPTIENIPPISQMREGGAAFSALGVAPDDLARCCALVPGLGVTFDLSHAGLYLEAVAARAAAVDPALRPVVEAYAPGAEARTLDAYLDRIEPWLVNVHVSNAAGLLGEGLPYGEGRFDLDAIMPRLAARARFIVTEPLEPDQERARYMREAQARIASALGRVPVGA